MSAIVDEDRELVLSTLPAPSVPATVRAMLKARLTLWGLAEPLGKRAFDMQLCAAELVTNACQATPDDEITFRAVFERAGVWIGVWDSCDEAPVPKATVELEAADIAPDPRALDPDHDTEDIGGWGLALISGLAPERSFTRTPPRGKWVWCRFGL